MLRTATFFEYFNIRFFTGAPRARIPADNATAKVKWADNFATQFEININDNDDFDPFKWRYVTFDNNAVFEITDVIGNDNLYTFFIRYVTNILLTGALSAYDPNFYLSGQTPEKLEYLGLTKNQAIEIWGDTDLPIVKYTKSITNNNFIWFLKIKMSEIPDNLKYVYNTSTGNIVNVEGVRTGIEAKGFFGNRQSIDSAYGSILDFNNFENAFTVYMPLVFDEKINLVLKYQNKTETRVFSRRDMENALNKIMTDLVLSVEIVPFFNGSLQGIRANVGEQTQYQPVTVTAGTTPSITINCFTDDGVYMYDGYLRFMTPDPQVNPYPFFICETGAKYAGLGMFGFWEVYKFIPVYWNDMPTPAIPLTFQILNNIISLDTLRTQMYIQTFNGKIRIYTNTALNEFTEIDSTIQFNKSAYTNYDAYTKSNVELVNNQQRAQVKLQNEQLKTRLKISEAENVANTLTNVGRSLIGGNIGGAVLTTIGGITQGVTEAVKTNNVEIQNNNANAALNAAQAHETAQLTRTAGEILNGTNYLTSLLFNANNNYQIVFQIEYIDLSTKAIYQQKLYDYIIKNKIYMPINTTLTPPSVTYFDLLDDPPVVYYLKAKSTSRVKDAILIGKRVITQ